MSVHLCPVAWQPAGEIENRKEQQWQAPAGAGLSLGLNLGAGAGERLSDIRHRTHDM